VRISGDKPPCTHNVSPSIIYASVMENMGRVMWNRDMGTYRCEVKIVEYVTTCFPHGCATVFLLALVWVASIDNQKSQETGGDEVGNTVETVHLCYLSTFVVSS
jgi:hypothetical protein